MSIIATNKPTNNIPQIPAGTYLARCISMIHIGTLKETIGGKAEQLLNKVYFTFELPTEQHVFDEAKGPEPRVCGKEFTLSMSEKSNLRKFLQNWRGAPFTESEATNFDVTKLLGVECMLSLIHKVSGKGNTYTEIVSAILPMKGVTIPAQVNKMLEFNFGDGIDRFPDCPKFLREKIVTTPEWNAIDKSKRDSLLAKCEATQQQQPATGQTQQPKVETPNVETQQQTSQEPATKLPF